MKRLFTGISFVLITTIFLTACMTPAKTESDKQESVVYAVLNNLKTAVHLEGSGTVTRNSLLKDETMPEVNLDYDLILNNGSLSFNISNELANKEVENLKLVTSLGANLDKTEYSTSEILAFLAVNEVYTATAKDFKLTELSNDQVLIETDIINLNASGHGTKYSSTSTKFSILANAKTKEIYRVNIEYFELETQEKIEQSLLNQFAMASDIETFMKDANNQKTLDNGRLTIHSLELGDN